MCLLQAGQVGLVAAAFGSRQFHVVFADRRIDRQRTGVRRVSEDFVKGAQQRGLRHLNRHRSQDGGLAGQAAALGEFPSWDRLCLDWARPGNSLAHDDPALVAETLASTGHVESQSRRGGCFHQACAGQNVDGFA